MSAGSDSDFLYDSEDTMDVNDDEYDEYEWGGERRYMENLLSDREELSEDKQETMTKQFSKVFANRYPLSELNLFHGSINQALNQSIFNSKEPRPLILYIRHNESVAENIFCNKMLCSPEVVKYLNEHFVIWPWDRTDINNYRQYLELLFGWIGVKNASEIASYTYSKDQYPLLVCLSSDNNQITIEHILQSKILEESKMLHILSNVRYQFYSPNNEDNEIDKNWYIPKSHLTLISQQDAQFQKIANDLNIKMEKIIEISNVENIIWSMQYSKTKKKIDERITDNENEQRLFYGCPLSMAQDILRYGFNSDDHRIHGEKYGCGFYFSSKRDVCEKYTTSKSLAVDKKAIIICRILVGNRRLGASKYHGCPRGYDSTTNGSDIFVVYCNDQILPEYLVTYKE